MNVKRLDIFCPDSKNNSMLRDDNFCYSPHKSHAQIQHQTANRSYPDYAIIQTLLQIPEPPSKKSLAKP